MLHLTLLASLAFSPGVGEAVAGWAAFEFSFWDVQAQSEFDNLEEQGTIMMGSWNSNVRISSHKIEIVLALLPSMMSEDIALIA